MESERSRQNEFFKSKQCVYHFLFRNYRLSTLLFFHCFILWLALFANQHTKSIEKHKLFRLIAPKQVKIDMPCRNEKSRIYVLFQIPMSVFLIKTKIFSFSGLFTNSKQRYTENVRREGGGGGIWRPKPMTRCDLVPKYPRMGHILNT